MLRSNMTHRESFIYEVFVLFTLLSCCGGFIQRDSVHPTARRSFIRNHDFGPSSLALCHHAPRWRVKLSLPSQLSKKTKTSKPLPYTSLFSITFLLLIVSFMSASPLLASDFAGRDISGQNLANGNYMQQDFSGVKAAGTNFRNSNLQGCSFMKADLSNADLSGSDVRGASFQGSLLDGAIFKDVLASKATFSASILDVQTLENADLTDSLWPSQLQIMICDMPELKGTSSNGVVTRESILCN